MKKILILAITLFSFNAVNAQSSVIKANPLGLAVGVANAGYEFSVGEKNSLTISGIYYNVSSINGIGAGAEYRWYFGEENLKGWHAGPSAGFFSLKDGANNKATVFNIGAEGGHQWIFSNNFVVDVFGGLGIVTGGKSLAGLNSTALAIGVSLGYAW
ncbi:MAG: DUF3575 domain-containing protein [Flavobacteriaceae bacterium]|nr:DUF3575 domain-containing protein [Flavobacteriaceae bacterium]